MLDITYIYRSLLTLANGHGHFRCSAENTEVAGYICSNKDVESNQYIYLLKHIY